MCACERVFECVCAIRYPPFYFYVFGRRASVVSRLFHSFVRFSCAFNSIILARIQWNMEVNKAAKTHRVQQSTSRAHFLSFLLFLFNSLTIKLLKWNEIQHNTQKTTKNVVLWWQSIETRVRWKLCSRNNNISTTQHTSTTITRLKPKKKE